MKKNRPLNEEKRKAIIKAAVDEFHAKGYEGSSMDTISKKAGVSKATVYNHFGSKKELFMSLMMVLKEILDKFHYIEYDQNRSIEEQLRKFATQELELVSNPYNMTLMSITINVIMNECEVTSIIKEMAKDSIFENLVIWFEDAKADSKLTFDDAEFVAQQFVGNIKCFAFYPQLYGVAQLLPKNEWSNIIENAVKIITMLYKVKTS